MEYFGTNSKMKKLLDNNAKLVKEFGKQRAQKIIKRLDEFQIANSLSEISHLPPARLHKLQGDRENQFAVDIDGKLRIVFVGYDEDDLFTTDKDKIVSLEILEIVDYHS